MTKRNKDVDRLAEELAEGLREDASAPRPGEPAPEAAAAPGQPDGVPDTPHGALVEAPDAALRRVSGELEELRDRHLRLAADFDNFRKRVARERVETWARAQADVISKVLDALDDLGRVAHVDLAKAEAKDILSGVELVERKLLRELEGAGLERVGQPDEPFDPSVHEAVGTRPADSAERDHTVADIVQTGYRFAGALLRPAKVVVRMWMGDED